MRVRLPRSCNDRQTGNRDRPTVDRGLRETVTYRNALEFFPDLGIEMVRAPPLRATETTVT
jgi:hypothetical protein